LGCEEDGKEESVPFLRLPDACASWCEAGHCREGEGRLSVRTKSADALPRFILKFSCTASDVLRSRGREFYSIGIQRLTQSWKKCVENDGDFMKK
jgi:hypothetical protein